MEKAMTKEDWIILRLLKASGKTQSTINPDYVRSVVYLLNKYGMAGLTDSITQLQKEDKR
jgi:hypothetical protein